MKVGNQERSRHDRREFPSGPIQADGTVVASAKRNPAPRLTGLVAKTDDPTRQFAIVEDGPRVGTSVIMNPFRPPKMLKPLKMGNDSSASGHFVLADGRVVAICAPVGPLPSWPYNSWSILSDWSTRTLASLQVPAQGPRAHAQ